MVRGFDRDCFRGRLWPWLRLRGRSEKQFLGRHTRDLLESLPQLGRTLGVHVVAALAMDLLELGG